MVRVLIVEDSMVMRGFLGNFIEEIGCELVGEAVDGVEGLKKYKELMPDLVILDITMPKMNGLEFLKTIKIFDPESNIVICSSLGQEAVVEETLKLGALDFIAKPFADEEVIQKLKDIVNKIKSKKK